MKSMIRLSLIAVGLGFLLALALRAQERIPIESRRVITDKTQTAIWKSQAKVNRLNADLTAAMEELKKAVMEANTQCGEGWHMQQDAKEDLICAQNAEVKK